MKESFTNPALLDEYLANPVVHEALQGLIATLDDRYNERETNGERFVRSPTLISEDGHVVEIALLGRDAAQGMLYASSDPKQWEVHVFSLYDLPTPGAIVPIQLFEISAIRSGESMAFFKNPREPGMRRPENAIQINRDGYRYGMKALRPLTAVVKDFAISTDE